MAPKCRATKAAKRSGFAGMSLSGTLAEYEHGCHADASLGLAFLDNSLLARDSVICKP